MLMFVDLSIICKILKLFVNLRSHCLKNKKTKDISELENIYLLHSFIFVSQLKNLGRTSPTYIRKERKRKIRFAYSGKTASQGT